MGQEKKVALLSTFTVKYSVLLISTNQNLFSCEQISSFKPLLHQEYTENGGSKQCRFIQWATIRA